MKITAAIMSLFILQTSASFFDDFRGAVVSVEHSFGRIISEVVSDVRVTIDCTIYAVEHALSLDGIFRNTSEHEKKCKQKTTTPASSTEVVTSSYTPPTAKQKKPASQTVVLKGLSTHIETSIDNVNKSISTVLGKGETYKKIETVQHKLKNETERLSEVGALLSHELDSISKKVKKEIKAADLEDKPTVEDILSEVKILHELEESRKNTSEAKEIRLVFDKVLKILHANTTESPESQNNEIKKIIQSLEKSSNVTFSNIENQYSQWKKGEKKHIENIKDAVMNQKSEDRELPAGFREIFDRLNDATGKINKVNSSSSTASKVSSTTQKSPSLDVDLFNKLFGSNREEKVEQVNKVKNLIRQSKVAESFVNDMFSNTENAVNLFDNPELFNGK